MLVLLLMAVALPAAFSQEPAVSGQSATAAQPGYVGSEACRTCHADLWMNFYRNPHFKSLAAGLEPPGRTGCEGCHGPGKVHVEAKGGKATIPKAFSLMHPVQVLETCLMCHSRDLSRSNIQRSEHTQAKVACTSCHSIHHSPTPKSLLAKRQPELCYGCHAQVRGQFSMPFKHRVNEGFMVCTDCHNPHGTSAPAWRMSTRPRMVDQVLGNEEPCLKCHSDKRGPFAFEHAPVRVDGCETCHFPHGSMNTRLLRRPVLFTLCLECHNGAGNYGRNGRGIPLQSPAHNMADPRFQRCTTCHVRIHGSNADAAFLR